MNKSKIIFYLIWIVLLSLAPITILENTSFALITRNYGTMANAVQRLFGLWALTLMFVQIVLGSFMTKLTEKFGGWIFKFHVMQGILVYFLILVHGTAFVVFNYLIGHGFDPFFVFVDVCVLCGKAFDHYYNFGRVAFWLVTLAVAAGYFRTVTPFLRVHWKKFHILNFVAFLLIGIHSLFLGSDVGTFPFSLIHAPSLVIVIGIVVFKIYKSFIKKAK